MSLDTRLRHRQNANGPRACASTGWTVITQMWADAATQLTA